MSRRFAQIDIIKGLAIISVVLLHGLNYNQQMTIQTAFHISQAVPVFFLLMAMNAKGSFDRRYPDDSLGRIYGSGYLLSRLRRLLPPFLLAAAIALLLGLVKRVPLYFGLFNALLWMPVPLVGQFFVAVSIAFVLFAPLLYRAYKKAPLATLVFCVMADLVFEVIAATMVHALDAPTPHAYYVYQIMPVRFLALFGIGMWLHDQGADVWLRRKKILLPAALVSALYLAGYAVGLRTGLLDFEHMYNIFAFGYPLLLVALGLYYLPSTAVGVPARGLERLGRASYHIFLVQAVWYSSSISLFRQGDLRWLLPSLIVCCGLGVVWSEFRLPTSGSRPAEPLRKAA